MDQNALKEQTGKESVKYIKSGMIVGLDIYGHEIIHGFHQ